MLRISISALLLTTLLFGSSSNAADENTTVALTAAVYQESGQQELDLMAALLQLLESEVSTQPGLSVVERRQIDLVLHELALSKDLGHNDASRLQLGKIASADLILTLELKKPEQDDESPQVLIRIVESLTGIIRGVSVTSIEDERIDEAAGQIARYLAMIRSQPNKPPITVAVAPFESKGRFDRLRPLERGLRDMIATRLLRWSDTIVQEKDHADAGDVRGFQVLQRSGMQELLRELDLIQSALVDPDRLPTTLPTRAAAFLVRGEIDEKNDGGGFRIVVAGQLVHAASNKVIRDFTFEAKPEELEAALAHQIDMFAGRLVSSKDEISLKPGRLRERNEVDLLFGQVVADLQRLQRRRPSDFSHRTLELPVKAGTTRLTYVAADTPLGRAILKKSIDRLESTLYIQPDRADVAFALGFCYSFHMEGIWNADRADELLRRAAGSDPESPLAAAALTLLAEISYHHSTGHRAADQERRAIDQMFHALQNVPEKPVDRSWAHIPRMMTQILGMLDDDQLTVAIFERAAAVAEDGEPQNRRRTAGIVDNLSTGLISRASKTGVNPIPLLRRWASGEEPTLKQLAENTLERMAQKPDDHLAAAKRLLTQAEALANSTSYSDRYSSDNMRVRAAGLLRRAGEPGDALDLLQSFEPKPGNSLNSGYHAVELGLCYMETQENEKALEVLVAAAERVPSLRDNSAVEQLINKLGGVPLNKDRDIDVTYVNGPDGSPIQTEVLATDGVNLFCAGPYRNKLPRGVVCLDPVRESWQTLTTSFDQATCMSVHNGELWVGTASEGVWRCVIAGNDWKQWSTDTGLPDDRVTAITATQAGVFVGLGTSSAGGIVSIDDNGDVNVMDGEYTPTSAPSSLALQDGRLLATTPAQAYAFRVETKKWISPEEKLTPTVMRVFPGKSHAWASSNRREIFPYGADKKTAEHFRAAWFNENGRGSYSVQFVIEHQDQIWFGGSPWARFRSVGFYRIDPQTGDFRMYGLRDGFRMSSTYTTDAGVVIGDDLWLATSAGLARVALRSVADVDSLK